MTIYPKSTLERLEFQTVREWLVAYCAGGASKQLARDLMPTDDSAEVIRLMNEVSELHQIRINKLSFPDYQFIECKKELSVLPISGAILDAAQCILLKSLVESVSGLLKGINLLESAPALQSAVANHSPKLEIADQIDRIVEPNGPVRSSASRELADIRKEMDEVRRRRTRVFETLLRKYQKLGWVREYGESVYHDRRVLAIVAEHKNKVDGIIHGSSESGNTAFVEPESLVGLNNHIVDLKHREEQEIRRILKQLTAVLSKHSEVLNGFFEVQVFMDFLDAKVKLAIELKAVKPEVEVYGKEVHLINARHPVLYKQNIKSKLPIVPLEVVLKQEQSILVISGPNAGGKSIALKTVGLLQIMLQSGLLVPVDERSKMKVFAQLLVDIGDDQSIEHQLSTYSSRLKKLKHFMRVADSQSLILLDEFGTGSDPELGGAIAEAILIELIKFSPWGIITTHFSNIKIAAENLSGLINGSMMFNEQTLEPLYVLKIGSPGSSYTFEVARKIGLDPKVLKLAKTKVDQRKVKLDKLLVDLQLQTNQLISEKQDVKVEKNKMLQELERLEKEMEKIVKFQDSLNKPEHIRLIENGKKYEALLDFWNKTKNRKELSKKLIQAAEKASQKQKMKEISVDSNIVKPKSGKKRKNKLAIEPWKLITEGDKVRLRDGKSSGTVEQIVNNKAVVVFGNMKLTVASKELILLMKKK